MNRILVVDIDGVLNSRRFYIAKGIAQTTRCNPDRDLDPQAIARLQSVVDRAHCDIVIASAWRLLFKLEDLRRILHAKGLTAKIVGVTPALPKETRSREIAAWLRASSRRVDSFAIVDDDPAAGLLGRLVLTRAEVGLTEHDADKLVALLLQDCPFPVLSEIA